MAKKLKLNLSGLKNQIKTGKITIDYLNGKVDYPIKLKNDREYKYILNLSDYKYKTIFCFLFPNFISNSLNIFKWIIFYQIYSINTSL